MSPSGTGSIWAATAASTRCCVPWTSPRRAAPSPPKDYLGGKRADHKTAREARRAHKRLLANVIIRRMWADHQRRRSPTMNVFNQATPKAA